MNESNGLALSMCNKEKTFKGVQTHNGILKKISDNSYATGFSKIKTRDNYEKARFGFGFWYDTQLKDSTIYAFKPDYLGAKPVLAGIVTFQPHIASGYPASNNVIQEYNKTLLAKDGYLEYKQGYKNRYSEDVNNLQNFDNVFVGYYMHINHEDGSPFFASASEVEGFDVAGKVIESTYETLSWTVKLLINEVGGFGSSGGDGTVLTDDQLGAIEGANFPTLANPFMTIADYTDELTEDQLGAIQGANLPTSANPFMTIEDYSDELTADQLGAIEGANLPTSANPFMTLADNIGGLTPDQLGAIEMAQGASALNHFLTIEDSQGTMTLVTEDIAPTLHQINIAVSVAPVTLTLIPESFTASSVKTITRTAAGNNRAVTINVPDGSLIDGLENIYLLDENDFVQVKKVSSTRFTIVSERRAVAVLGSGGMNADTNIISLNGVGLLGLEVGDVVQATNFQHQKNNQLFTVESLVSDNAIGVNLAHANGNSAKSLVGESNTPNARIDLISKWYQSPEGLGQGWVSVLPNRAKNTIYTNPTKRPMRVRIEQSSWIVSNLMDVTNDILLGKSSAETQPIDVVVSGGVEYRLESQPAEYVIAIWLELR